MSGPQNQWEQLDAFSWDILEKISYYRKEFDIPIESMVGVLEVAKHDLINSIPDIVFEDDTEEDAED